MSQTLRLARCATMIAAAGCGGGDGGGSPNDGGFHACGNGTCETGEDCRGCREDCGACDGCGNGTCDGDRSSGTGENCRNCREDCGCGVNEGCQEINSSGDAACLAGPMCNFNGTCETGEDCTTCDADCGQCPDPCGDGTCTPSTDPALTEDCATCAADCACAGGQVCRSWEALGEGDACGTIPEDPTGYCGSACGSPNPLIGVLPGRWVRPSDNTHSDVTVDFTAPACGIPGHEAGDACVSGFSPTLGEVLSGTRLFIRRVDLYIEGRVLEGGSRVELDVGLSEAGPLDHYVWTKK